MKTSDVVPQDLSASVVAVPPLARNADLSLNREENRKLIRHLKAGGVTSLMYAGVLAYTRAEMGPMIAIHMLTALTASLLLLVCLNVANLLTIRTNERVQEFAIRNALGASPWRLVQSVLMDSLLICLLGSVLGIFVADLGMQFIGGLLERSGNFPFWWKFSWELSSSLAMLLVVLLIWFFSAGFAVWKVSQPDIARELGSRSTGSVSAGSSAGSVALVSFEIIVSCFLLIVSGVLIGTVNDLAGKDYGTATEGYLTSQVSLPGTTYADIRTQQAYRESMRGELQKRSGITSVTFATALPSQQGAAADFSLEDWDLLTDNKYPTQQIIQVAQDYFEIMEVPLRAGRYFNFTDTPDSLPVVIVDEQFAAQIWPNQSALSKRIQINPKTNPTQASPEWLTVVGVTSHIIQQRTMDGVPFQSDGNTV